MKNVTNKLRVHHYPQVPCNPFIVDVADEQEAKKIMDVLAEQHLFLFANNIIPDYSNSILYVKMEKTGELKHFDSNDVRLYGSPTYGEDLVPPIPSGWKNSDTVNKLPEGAKRNTDFLNK